MAGCGEAHRMQGLATLVQVPASFSIWPWIGFPNFPQCHHFIWEMMVLILTSLNARIFYSVLQIATHLVTSHVFIISQFKWGRSLADFSWILCSGSHEAAIKVSWGLNLLQDLDWKRPASKFIQIIDTTNFFITVSLRALDSCWLLARDISQHLEAYFSMQRLYTQR